MSSASNDLTARARIRKAAMSLFGERGVADVSMRAIADVAGVSAGLVVHHYGTKEGLVTEVNDALVERVKETMQGLDLATGSVDALIRLADEPATLAYLVRVIIDQRPASAALFDQLNNISRDFVAEMIESGAARPVEDPEALAAWLLAADIGLLVLRHHLARTLSADPFEHDGIARFAAVELDVLTSPLLKDTSQ